MNFRPWFESQNPAISWKSAEAVLDLSAEGATIPFIARYRKERTGNLDEVGIEKVIDAKEQWEQLTQRQAFIVAEIEKQGKLTPELKEKILTTFKPGLLEDLYLPYKQKRKTKAALAREAGLEPLADWIWNCGHGTETPQPGQTLEIWAFTFHNDEKGFKDAESTILGAQDILIERLSENPELRSKVREAVFERGFFSASKAEKAKPNSKYEGYFEFAEPVSSLLKPENSHRYLAVRRGWIEEELSLKLGGKPGDEEFEKELIRSFEGEACTALDSVGAEVLLRSARLALKAHVLPSIENEAHKALREVADPAAIDVFALNVRKLLLSAPFGPKAVLGVDPGIRTGCKLALVDDSGKYIASTVMHLQSEDGKKNAKTLLGEIVKNAEIRAIAVGNGTAGRETEVFLRAALKELGCAIPVVMVSESGASVYSASEVAREEFPELDATVRGAISIARRLQDPLAELVKIDPKSIGVGQYQHDVSQPALKRALDRVVDSCVNSVGVNLNTASYHLLAHVSGIGEALARAVVQHRSEKGLFKNRSSLLDVPRFSAKVFEQAAGFLRVPESDQPLDNTGVHPERYEAVESIAKKLGKPIGEILGHGAEILKKAHAELKEFEEKLGSFTFQDILGELEKPGRDPRETLEPFQFRDDIFELKDLKTDMICPGIVTNVTNFGAFVDIGVHQDGLVHISQLSNKFIKDPKEAVSPGDRVRVKVLEVNLEKKQISLSIKQAVEQAPREHREHRERQPRGEKRPPRGKGGPRPGQAAAPKKPSGPPPNVKPKPAFNNPFGSLASLRNTLKKS